MKATLSGVSVFRNESIMLKIVGCPTIFNIIYGFELEKGDKNLEALL